MCNIWEIKNVYKAYLNNLTDKKCVEEQNLWKYFNKIMLSVIKYVSWQKAFIKWTSKKVIIIMRESSNDTLC